MFYVSTSHRSLFLGGSHVSLLTYFFPPFDLVSSGIRFKELSTSTGARIFHHHRPKLCAISIRSSVSFPCPCRHHFTSDLYEIYCSILSPQGIVYNHLPQISENITDEMEALGGEW